MAKSWAMLALATSAVFSMARAACVDIDQYLDIPSPMTGDMEINLDAVETIECEEIGEFAEGNAYGLETVVVDGGTLTLKSSNTVRFVDMAFKVRTGANLEFDMPKANFGPNTEAMAFLEITASGFLNVSEPPSMPKAEPEPAVFPSKVTALLKLKSEAQTMV